MVMVCTSAWIEVPVNEYIPQDWIQNATAASTTVITTLLNIFPEDVIS
jgi:hypothetical protein